MPSFEIPDGPTTIPLKNITDKGQTFRTGSASFTVTNKSGGTVRASFGVEPQGDAKAAWFDIPGEKERNFADNETQKINVNIKTPANATTGDYKFRFVTVNVNQTDTDFTKSAVVTFNVAAIVKPPTPPPNMALIIGIIVGIVLLAGGGFAAWWFLSGPTPPPPAMVSVPGVVGQSYASAETALKAKGLVSKQRNEVTGKPPGVVAAQDPAANTQLAKGGTVNLDVGKGTKVPDVRTKSPDAARQQLIDFGFNNVTVVSGPATGAAPNTVLSQVPEQNTDADPALPVTLTLDPGITVPDRTNWMLASIGNSFSGFNVTVNTRYEVGTVGQIVQIIPIPGTVLKKNDPVTLVVRAAPCTSPLCRRVNKIPLKDFVTQFEHH